MNAENVKIRPVRLTDAHHLRDYCFTMNTQEEVEAGIHQTLEATRQGKEFQFVAVLDGAAIGVVSLIRRSHPLNAHRAEVAGLVVHPDFQGHGIARRLVESCQEKARQVGISILEISCRAGEPAEQIYPRLGFVEYGRLPQGLAEPWGEHQVFDQVYFYRALE